MDSEQGKGKGGDFFDSHQTIPPHCWQRRQAHCLHVAPHTLLSPKKCCLVAWSGRTGPQDGWTLKGLVCGCSFHVRRESECHQQLNSELKITALESSIFQRL